MVGARCREAPTSLVPSRPALRPVGVTSFARSFGRATMSLARKLRRTWLPETEGSLWARLLMGAAATVVGAALIRGSSFLATLLAARILGTVALGEFAMVQS